MKLMMNSTLVTLVVLACSVSISMGFSETMVDLLTTGVLPEDWDPVDHVTSLGSVSGRREATIGPGNTNPHYYAFRGIPYAEPPLGHLRLEEPVEAVGPWGRHLDATRFGPCCPQYDHATAAVLGDEDCLYLNIYTPALPGGGGGEPKELLPVFVFIHGGAYLRGSSSSHGPARILGRKIVLVTFNYRLGVLGYLSTGDVTIPGNYGSLDQVAALRWVQQHIKDFGGDPSRVTIGGFSAGASSVHFHMVSPRSAGLFHGAVMMSGSGVCDWAWQQHPLPHALHLARELQCPHHSSHALKTCVLTKTTEEVVRAQARVYRYEFWPMSYTVVVDAGLRDHPFLPGPVATLAPTAPVPVLIGTVPHESIIFTLVVTLMSPEPSNASAIYDQAASYVFSSIWNDPDQADHVGHLARSFYFDHYHDRHDLNALVEHMVEGLTDFLFTKCIMAAATTLASQGNTVYTYVNQHRDVEADVWAAPVYSLAKSVGVTSRLLDEGVSHGDDMILLFDVPGAATPQRGSSQEAMAHLVTSAWTTFIKDGSPGYPDWSPLKPGAPPGYMSLAPTPTLVFTPFKPKAYNFWHQTVPYSIDAMSKCGAMTQHCMASP